MAEIHSSQAVMEARMEELMREVASLRKRVEANETIATEHQNPVAERAPQAAASSSDIQPSGAARGGQLAGAGALGSLHQLTASCCVDPEVGDSARALHLLASFGLLYVQTQVLLGFMQGASNLPCNTNDDCGAGWLCVASSHTCVLCNDNAVNDGQTAWWAGDATNATAFCAQPDLTSKYPLGEAGCDACFDPTLGGHDWNLGRNSRQEMADAFATMRTQDWFASLLIGLVVGLSLASEVQDIKLCQFLVQQRGSTGAVPRWAKAGLFVLAAARQFGLMFVVIMAISSLIDWRGSDCINVSFNAIAVLFIVDVRAPINHWKHTFTRHTSSFGCTCKDGWLNQIL